MKSTRKKPARERLCGAWRARATAKERARCRRRLHFAVLKTIFDLRRLELGAADRNRVERTLRHLDLAIITGEAQPVVLDSSSSSKALS